MENLLTQRTLTIGATSILLAALGGLSRSAPGRGGRESRTISPIPAFLEERVGFEPTKRLIAFSGFQDRRIQPLCHLSMFRIALFISQLDVNV